MDEAVEKGTGVVTFFSSFLPLPLDSSCFCHCGVEGTNPCRKGRIPQTLGIGVHRGHVQIRLICQAVHVIRVIPFGQVDIFSLAVFRVSLPSQGRTGGSGHGSHC